MFNGKNTIIVGKKALCIIFVFLLSVNSFAAIVADSDGSSFVTKSEFEDLKANFSEQIDRYNSSIDGKIDGYIASYLAGIAISNKLKLEDEIYLARKDNNNNAIFAQWKTPQTTAHVADADAAFYMSIAHGCGPRSTNAAHGYHIISNVDATGNLKYKKYNGNDNSGSASNYLSAYYYAVFPFATLDHNNFLSTGNVTDWYLVSITRKRLYFKLTTKYNGFGNTYESLPSSNWYNYFGHVMKTFTTDYTLYDTTKNGPGAYTWPGPDSALPHLFTHKTAPTSQIEHAWYEKDSNDSTNNSFLNYNLSGTISNSTAYCVDYNFRDKYNDGNAFNVRIQKNLSSTTTHDGGNSCSAIVVWYWNGSTDTKWDSIRSDLYEVQNDVNFWYKWNVQKPYSLNWTKLTNKYYCGRLGKAHYKYYGIPICRTTGKVGNLKFKLKFTNTRTDSGSPLAFTYQIMDTQFSNGSMPTELKENGEDHVLKRETIAAGNATKEVSVEIEKLKIWDTTDGDYIYLKIEPSGSTQRVEVETVDSIIYEEDA